MIDAQLLDTYMAELDALHTLGSDFAESYPDIASRLDIGPRASRDPHVERVVQSSAFLAARMRLMVEEGATELPLAVLSMTAPGLVEPVPAMAVAQFEGGDEPQVVPRGARFDYESGGRAVACFSTAMDVVVAPFTVEVRRLAQEGYADGIGLRMVGTPPANLLLYVGNDAATAATLLDAMDEDLAVIELVAPDGGTVRVPKTLGRMRGFDSAEASLPVRRAAHAAHRTLIEFMVCPEKFRFLSFAGLPLRSGWEMQFRFSRRLALPQMLPRDLFTVNRVPVVNLWQVAATPFDVTGRQLEYPVRVDALRYRTVECHSVEHVNFHGAEGGQPELIDPVVALGDVQGTAVRWGVRRVGAAGKMSMYFQGLDYQELGQQRFLAAPTVLASNRDAAERAPVGVPFEPVQAMGNWTVSLASAPTQYQPPLMGARAMETLIGYLRSSMSGFAEGGVGALRDYLGRFPGADGAAWINGLGAIAMQPVGTVRQGVPQSGVRMILPYDGQSYRTTSQAMVGRVLNVLFNSQRGINRAEDVVLRPN